MRVANGVGYGTTKEPGSDPGLACLSHSAGLEIARTMEYIGLVQRAALETKSTVLTATLAHRETPTSSGQVSLQVVVR